MEEQLELDQMQKDKEDQKDLEEGLEDGGINETNGHEIIEVRRPEWWREITTYL